MTYKSFIESLCDAGIEASTNGYQLRKVLSLSTPSLKGWIKEGLPVGRNVKGHMVFDIQTTICWLIENNRPHYAGTLHDHYNSPPNTTDHN